MLRMNINRLLLWLNLVAVLPTLVFYIYLKALPEVYKSYINGMLLLIVVIFSAGPFIINYLLLRKNPISKQKTPYFLFLFFLLVVINLFCLFVMYNDQLSFSRGFGLLFCMLISLFVFLPIWIIGFIGQIK